MLDTIMVSDSKNLDEQLRKALAAGTVADFASGIADEYFALTDSKSSLAARRLPAEAIRALLLGTDVAIDPRGLRVRGARIVGHLDFENSALPCRLEFDDCQFEITPTFKRATVPGLVITNSALAGFSAESARIGGDVKMAGVRSNGTVDFRSAHIGGQLVLDGATALAPGGSSLILDAAEIAGHVSLAQFCAQGEVSGRGVRVGGSLFLTSASLSNHQGNALALDGADIALNAQFVDLNASGEVRALGIRIGGQLTLAGAVLHNANRNALSLDGAEITHTMVLDGVSAIGTVRALGARVRGQLTLMEATLSNPGGPALVLDQAEIAMPLLQGLNATGEVRAVGARMTGELNLANATLCNPKGLALLLNTAQLSGDAILGGITATGEVRADGMKVSGQLVLNGASLSSDHGDALNLANATIGTLLLDGTRVHEGSVNLSFVSIRILSVGERSADGLPRLSSAQGWSIGAVDGFLLGDRAAAILWLDTVNARMRRSKRPKFVAQPWRELARTYDETGQPEDGRWLRLQAAMRTTRAAPWLSKLPRWLYGATVGYGYYPVIVIAWLILLALAVYAVSSLNASAFTPTSPKATTVAISVGDDLGKPIAVTGATPSPAGYPKFDARLMALDTALPAATTGQAAQWQPTGNSWITLFFASVKSLSWILTALLLAGVTGLLRKD